MDTPTAHLSSVNFREICFIQSASKIENAPPDRGWEVAFAGRSNSGKSSAINTLTGKRKLARTSRTPGRTQLINFFGLSDSQRLVDLPGYGFAKAPKAEVAAWTRLLRDYLRGRVGLRRLCLLLDARHGICLRRNGPDRVPEKASHANQGVTSHYPVLLRIPADRHDCDRVRSRDLLNRDAKRFRQRHDIGLLRSGRCQ